jgi:hypothetical protein
MKIITEGVKEVIEKAELVTMGTNGENGQHMVATWAEYIRSLDINDGKTLIVPVGGYHQTENNLAKDDRVELVIGSKLVQGKRGLGTGYRLSGRAKIITSGKLAELTKSKYPWARAALVIEVDNAEQLL